MIFHRHIWRTEHRTEMSSAWEQMGEPAPGYAYDIPRWVFRRLLVLEQRCECGATRVKEVVNP